MQEEQMKVKTSQEKKHINQIIKIRKEAQQERVMQMKKKELILKEQEEKKSIVALERRRMYENKSKSQETYMRNKFRNIMEFKEQMY